MKNYTIDDVKKTINLLENYRIENSSKIGPYYKKLATNVEIALNNLYYSLQCAILNELNEMTKFIKLVIEYNQMIKIAVNELMFSNEYDEEYFHIIAEGTNIIDKFLLDLSKIS